MDFEIIFNCPECGAEVSAQSNTAGQTLRCGACLKNITIPIPGLEEGLEIGDFVLRGKLGSGGMGEVWLATQISMRRLVALKILLPKFADNQRFVDRFLAEAAMAGQLSHPNIITAYSAGQVGNYYYLATSYIDGAGVAAKLKIDGNLPEREALKIARDIALALKYAWDEHQMLHRDVKPGNFMLDRKGVARLMDMGISKSLKDSQDETATNIVLGTPDYISPEQARAEKNVDFRSDIYSLGASLYHMAAGCQPFQGETAGQVLHMHVKTPLTPPDAVNPSVSRECSALIQIMMAKNPGERQSSWDYVVDDIDAVLAGRMPGKKSLGLTGKDKKTVAASRANDVISLQRHPGPAWNRAPAVNSGNTDVTMPMEISAGADAQNTPGQTAPKPAAKPAAPPVSPPPPIKTKTKTVPPKVTGHRKAAGKNLLLALLFIMVALIVIVLALYWLKK